jgi:hypothetical protein
MMLDLASGKLTRLAFATVLAGAVTLLADTGLASTRKLSGTHSFGEIASTCGSSGGSFGVNVNGGYSCTSKDGGVVSCSSKGQCYGGCKNCPASVRDVNGILHPPSSAGSATAAAGTTNNNKPPVHNVNQPVVVQRSSGHSGGTKH